MFTAGRHGGSLSGRGTPGAAPTLDRVAGGRPPDAGAQTCGCAGAGPALAHCLP